MRDLDIWLILSMVKLPSVSNRINMRPLPLLFIGYYSQVGMKGFSEKALDIDSRTFKPCFLTVEI